MTKFVWPGGKGVVDESTAQIVGDFLSELESKHGVLEPATVVDAARSENSPIHRFFEWDNKKAAQEHRLAQARFLIRQVHVKIIDGNDIRAPIRAFVNVLGSNSNRYENIVSVMSDTAKRQQVLARARNELAGWRKRYSDLQEFSQVFSAIDNTTRLEAAE